MLNCFTRRPIYINKLLSDYCRKSTDEYIKKLTEKHNLERNKQKFKNPLEEEDNEKPNFNFYNLLLFLSISTISLYFYKRIK